MFKKQIAETKELLETKRQFHTIKLHLRRYRPLYIQGAITAASTLLIVRAISSKGEGYNEGTTVNNYITIRSDSDHPMRTLRV